MADTGKLSVVTGASTGIGRELARLCAKEGHDLILCADDAALDRAAAELRDSGGSVRAVRADLAMAEGVGQLVGEIGERPVDHLMANAGVGLGDAFLEQSLDDVVRVIRTNVEGTTRLLHHVGRGMAAAGRGRILVTGSIAGEIPGSYQAVYNATKAYLDSLSYAIRNELEGTGVSVTCLMPGPTDTAFFTRAGMEETPVGQDDGKDNPAQVARIGYDAMMRGDGRVVSGFMNKVQSMFAGVIADEVLAKVRRRMTDPDRADG
ncbi:SDR family NAD(P)-dependent oxidoreductase [Oceaniglobus roseus]|uniref:SDR family NAD(P)-dependent oxidoreductase n=1 Tax=Oceaniglobus roseus TaxID=1737570 RepID=UPI000C7EAF79|nr:SDR family NAD(P)-dependent oxidoreductase [Kandeliimicrobium roseum]